MYSVSQNIIGRASLNKAYSTKSADEGQDFPEIIEAQGFKIVDMTEIKGQVYFTSQVK